MHKTAAMLQAYLQQQNISQVTAPDPGVVLGGITADSRKVGPRYIFVAERGVNVDGHTFIPAALQAGAAAVVCQTLPAYAAEHPDVYWIKVTDSAEALGRLASWWYDHPSRRLTLVGVTGTNGKTTIATLLSDTATLMGEKAGLLSTVVNRIGSEEIPATHTTPDAITINMLLHQMVEAGCTFCAMEVSSHACAQKRIAGLRFAGGVFTNLTRDHLDYHGTFANYLEAKKSFFDSLEAEAFALTNADDRNGAVMLQNCRARRRSYALQHPADYKGRVIEDRIDGMLISFDGTEVETAFTGRFNASNLTAVYGASLLCGWRRDDVLRAISTLSPVSGRMQTIAIGGITAIVDYAHTPDALANVLDTIAEVKGAGAVITVAGAGGDRDKGKRPLMAAEAARRSDVLIITSDNPRSEDPAVIAAEMLAGVPEDCAARVITVLDRSEAIRRAVDIASAGDVVLIAGKGHETYQIVGAEKRHFDDREQVRQALETKYLKR